MADDTDVKRDPITQGVYIGRPKGEAPAKEAEHFERCPGCGQWFDCRDLGQVFDHVGELPHRVAGHG